jgi:hypothetical protein
MLQVLHLDISEVDRMLHLPHRFLLPILGVSFSPNASWASVAPLSFWMLVTFGTAWTLSGHAKQPGKQLQGASKPVGQIIAHACILP